MALTAALLARGWLTALVFGLIGYAVTVVLQPAVLGLVMGSPELGLFNLVALQRGGITPQLFATTTQFVVMTLLIYWAGADDNEAMVRMGVETLRGSDCQNERMPWLKQKSASSTSTSGRSIQRRTACCAWCWNSTARWWSASIPTSGCCIAAPRS